MRLKPLLGPQVAVLASFGCCPCVGVLLVVCGGGGSGDRASRSLSLLAGGGGPRAASLCALSAGWLLAGGLCRPVSNIAKLVDFRFSFWSTNLQFASERASNSELAMGRFPSIDLVLDCILFRGGPASTVLVALDADRSGVATAQPGRSRARLDRSSQ
eukprot:COSAG05_NODE_2251_length_3338_cov_2.404755_4_plen_158_part_00